MKINRLSINYIYQISYQILTIISPLITVPYISRILGAYNNGIYTYTYTIVNYFVIFSALGIESYGNRLIAQEKIRGKENLNKSFSSLFILHIIVTSIVALIYFFYITYIVEEFKIIFAIQSLWIISAFFDINWFFFGIEEFRLTVTRNFIIKILSIVCVFIFVRTNRDLWIYTAILGFGQLISNMYLWGVIKRYVSIRQVSCLEILSHIKPLLVLFFAVIASSIYRMIDKFMLGKLGFINDLASYEYADRMIRMLLTVITALGTVMLPRMSALYANGDIKKAEKYMSYTAQIMFITSSALAFGLASIADDFMMLLLGDGYDSSIILTKVLCVSLPIMGWNNLVRTQIIMPNEKDKIYVIAVWAGAIVNIILNFILINHIGVFGAALATVISYLIVAIFQIIPIWKQFRISFLLRYSIIPLLNGSLMYIIIRIIRYYIGSGLIQMIIEVVLGMVVYLILTFLYLKNTKSDLTFLLLKKQ